MESLKNILYIKSANFINGIYTIVLDNISSNRFINGIKIIHETDYILIKIKHSVIPLFKKKGLLNIESSMEKDVYLIENSGEKKLIYKAKLVKDEKE